ncbi:MAG: YraN family protein, partial [Clostridia bacterium]|nr:YraN family protein [Clostridia bacterium]
RLRKHTDHGSGAETVDFFKQRKLTKAAWVFLKMQNMTESPARFDVVSISGDIEADYQVEIIQNAFMANY